MRATRRIFAGLLALLMVLGAAPPSWAGSSSPPPPAGAPAPTDPEAQADAQEATPPRVSYVHGEVSFCGRAPPTGPRPRSTCPGPRRRALHRTGGHVEIQIGPRSFARAAYGAQIGLDNQEPDFIQLRVTSGYAALDLRELAPGHTVGARYARRCLHDGARRVLPHGDRAGRDRGSGPTAAAARS